MARLRIEDIPKPLLCVPLVLQWLWLALRYRSATLPSVINPRIESGGMVGESKTACLEQIGASFAPWVAAWRVVGPGQDPLRVRRDLGCGYPLIAKPDVGWCGFGVRRIESDSDLAAYAAAFPPEAAFMLQDLVAAPLEAGLFYARAPGDAHGGLLSVTLRHPPSVIGDGRHDAAALIGADRALRRHAAEFHAALGPAALADVPAAGAVRVLTTVASLRVGACYEDASRCVTAALESRIDDIARGMPDFHWGRFDVRFDSLAALQQGAFRIIEVNGAGSEAINFWDPSLPLASAFRGVFAKQARLFELSAAMRRAGHVPIGAAALARLWLRQRRLIARYPSSN